MSVMRVVVVLCGFAVACGCESSKAAERPDSGAYESPVISDTRQISALPACLTDQRLMGQPISELMACAPGACRIFGAVELCSEGGRYVYCPDGCEVCAPESQFSVWVKCGVITAFN